MWVITPRCSCTGAWERKRLPNKVVWQNPLQNVNCRCLCLYRLFDCGRKRRIQIYDVTSGSLYYGRGAPSFLLSWSKVLHYHNNTRVRATSFSLQSQKTFMNIKHHFIVLSWWKELATNEPALVNHKKPEYNLAANFVQPQLGPQRHLRSVFMLSLYSATHTARASNNLAILQFSVVSEWKIFGHTRTLHSYIRALVHTFFRKISVRDCKIIACFL